MTTSTKSSVSSNKSLMPNTLGIASLVTGGYHGFYDAQGVYLSPSTEWMLIYGPTLVRGGVSGFLGGIYGAIGGGMLGLYSFSSRLAIPKQPSEVSIIEERALEERLGEATLKGAITGVPKGIVLGGFTGAGKGAIQTLVGYGIGYMVGYVTK